MFNLPVDVRKLLLTRGMRSFWQGMMVVDLTLYLAALEWSGKAIGVVLTLSSIVGALLIILVGIMSDRLGRKPFLLISETLTLVSAVGACVTINPIFLALAIIFANFGRGQTGTAGPFAPAEQAWLARLVPFSVRGKVFSYNNAIGFFGMGIGALMGGLPAFMQNYMSEAISYRPIFGVVVLISMANLLIITTLKEPEKEVEDKDQIPANQAEYIQMQKETTKKENKQLAKLAFVNAINGTGIGLIGPLMAYWFSVKYGVGTAQVGVTISLSFILTSFASLLTGRLTEKLGMIKSVVWLRLIGFFLLILLPFSPFFWLASVLYIIRNAMNRGTQGARQAVSASITRDRRRGLSTSISAFSMRMPASAGPTISGALIESGLLAWPFMIAGGLQLGYVFLYGYFFKGFDKIQFQQKTARTET
ncbi:MFS transporter [Tuberibacillus sp. Marseille-P3662]|uniref:MFS transporter n=1 Tax=Tuberibacillus sp. Marseille-P3662 TaxID=1965358 RepID=UPI000A1C7E75|nr:MFS transporter [Tuberibacillus sp. Marseille-P3662]